MSVGSKDLSFCHPQGLPPSCGCPITHWALLKSKEALAAPLHLTLHKVARDGALCSSLSIVLEQALPVLQEQFPALEQARDASRA